MTDFIHTEILNRIGFITLDRPKALHSLTLDMVRSITQALLAWRSNTEVNAVVLKGSGDKAFCAGGDIRFFHECGSSTPLDGSARLEDFFTEEYALNHLIHFYPKPYIALMDGIVMGGGMGVAQAGTQSRMRVVTERTRMAMPEVNIGLFPDVGASYFLSRAPGEIGTYLGLTGEVIGAKDAIYAGLADVFMPSRQLGALEAALSSTSGNDAREQVLAFAAAQVSEASSEPCILERERGSIDRHFSFDSVPEIVASLADDQSEFARKTLDVMKQRSPLMMCVTLAQLRRGANLGVGDCLRMERTMVRRSFEQGEVLEGIRSVVIDKDNDPHWSVSSVDAVAQESVDRFFVPAWPDHAHPLRDL